MAKLVALYRAPSDPTAFYSYYYDSHVPIAKRLPGLRKYEVSTAAFAPDGDASPYHLVATMHFDSVEAIEQAMESPQGQTAAADLSNFADGGVDLIYFDDNEV